MNVSFEIEAHQGTVAGEIRAGNRCHRIQFQADTLNLSAAPEAFTLLALPAAMRLGLPLQVSYPISAQLRHNLDGIQKLLNSWLPQFQIIPTEATITSHEPALARREAVYFTGGVDSFYTTIKRPEADLLYVWGLDIQANQSTLSDQVRSQLQAAAQQMDRAFFELHTDLRSYLDQYSPWFYVYGIALAAIAQLLKSDYSRLNLSPSFRDPLLESTDPALIDGGHSDLVKLLGTEDMAFCGVGNDARRVDKLQALADLRPARSALRVCWENRGQAYNCGACEKCVRTMVGLAAIGKLQEFDVFNRPLSYAAVSRCVPTSTATRSWWQDNLDVARARGTDPQLIASLEKSLNGPFRGMWRLRNRYLPRRVKDWMYRLNASVTNRS